MRLRLAPRGASGLKSKEALRKIEAGRSRPARGEWIEINIAVGGGTATVVSRPARGEWIEITVA